jgi:cob(I)alamin adenosyltransferase
MKHKIYTKTGDRGRTALVGKSAVAKDDIRIEAMGTIDELVSFTGMAAALLGGTAGRRQRQRQEIREALTAVESKLLTICGILAGSGAEITNADIAGLEEKIDRWEESLEPLVSFILPGGGPVSAGLHVCRTVCRRAERRLAAVARQHAAPVEVSAYVNRLSDFFFVLARYTGKMYGEQERGI